MSRLIEAVNYEFYKDKIDKKTFDWFCSLDPSVDKKYSRWIIEWGYKDYIKNIVDAAIEIGQKTGENPVLPIPFDYIFNRNYKGDLYNNYKINLAASSQYRFYEEDASKITEDLSNFTKLRNKKALADPSEYNIMNIKGFKALWTLINKKYADILEDIISNEPIGEDEREIWYDNNNYLVVVPLTHKAAKKYGAQTRWCTTYKNDSSYFDEYSKEGPLIIIIDKNKDITKNNLAKVQIHIPTNQMMDASDTEIDRNDYLDSLPADVKSAIYNHTHYFLFNPNKMEIAKKIFDSPEIWHKVQSLLLRESFFNKATGSNGDNSINIETILLPPMLKYAFNDNVWEEVIRNDDTSYSYGYDHPQEYLPEDTIPANIEELGECEGCDGTGYALYYRNPHTRQFQCSIPKEVFLSYSARMQKENPEIYTALLRNYKYNERTDSYNPDPLAGLVEVGKIAQVKCPFCHGSGKEEYDREDAELYSEEQREDAAQKAEEAGVEYSCNEWYKDFVSKKISYSNRENRELIDKIADTYINEFLPNEEEMEKSCITLINLIILYDINIDKIIS